MSFRFRKSVQLFPGVRLNFSRSGVSTTIGVRGAGVTIGPRGTYANVGLPGTGLSYRARLDRPVGGRRPSDAVHPSAPGWIHPPEATPDSPGDAPPRPDAPWLGPYERIGSASVEYLTSPGLQALRDLVNEVADRRRDLEREIARLSAEIRWRRQLERIYRLLFLRLLTFPLARSAERKRIAAEAARAELEEMLAVTGFELDFAIDDVVAREFGELERAYQRVRRSAQIWDVTGRAAIKDWVRARTIARQSIEREPVGLDLAQAPFVHGRWQALRFGNVNGEDLYLYPGFVMVQSPEGSFALLEIDRIDLESYLVRYHEDERLPADARVVGHTWLKANKDNTPDRRFRDNRQIPVALYGWLEFRSGGLHEAYMVSDAEAAAAFATAFERYRRVLAEFAKRGGSVTHEASARDAKHEMITGEDAEPAADVAKLAPRRFGLGFPVTDLALAAILARVVIGGLPLEAPVQTWPAAAVSETPVLAEPAAEVPIAPVQAQPAPSVSEVSARAEPATRAPVAPVHAEPAAGKSKAPVQAKRSVSITEPRVQTESEHKYWVTVDRLNRRTCPSAACGIVGQLFFREAATVYEQRGGWARISNDYAASCVNGRSEYVDTGNNRCTPDNGIVDGRFAEWVSAEFLSQEQPPDPAAGATGIEALVAQSDDYRIYKAAFEKAAQSLISSGQCSEADFREIGGWLKSSDHRDQPIYVMYCGGGWTYLDAATGEILP